jgi:hypothetical protein
VEFSQHGRLRLLRHAYLNGTVYEVNTSYLNQSGWDLEEIDTAFRMDLNANGDPYNVWLDQVTLTVQ